MTLAENRALLRGGEHSATVKSIVDTVFGGYVVEEPPTDEKSREILGELGVDLTRLEQMTGRQVFDARFDTSLVGLVQLAFTPKKELRHPDKELWNKEVLEYYLDNPAKLNKLRGKWKEVEQGTGIITPFTPIPGETIEAQVDRYLSEGPTVDQYSEEDRYPKLFSAIRKVVARDHNGKLGGIVEFGTAAGDNLLALQSAANKLVGNDIATIEEIVNGPMLAEYRWHRDEIKRLGHLDAVRKSRMTFVRGSMLDKEVVDQVFGQVEQPTLVLLLNVLIHFASYKTEEMLSIVLPHQPKYLVIGGGYPGLVQTDERGNKIKGRYSTLFLLEDLGGMQVLGQFVDVKKPS